MRKIRIAQIGVSHFGHGAAIFNTLKKNSDVFEIVGYALPEGERVKFPNVVKCFDGYTEMTVEEILSDKSIEAVAIEGEEINLTKYGILAARAGKHIHFEKPGSPSLDGFREMIGGVKENGVKFHMGYMYRYNPVIRDVISRVRAGEIGEVLSVEAQMSCRHGEAFANWIPTLEGGMMLYLGCHLVDLVLTIQGEPLKVTPVNRSSGRYGVENNRDLAFALLEYERGVSFVKAYAAECSGYGRRQLVITGTEGRFEICPLEVNVNYPLVASGFSESKSDVFTDRAESVLSEPYDRYDDMMRSFGEFVCGERENPYTPDYELKLFELIKKCCE